MYEIQLTARESNWRLFMVRKADPAFAKFQQKIFERDAYQCCYCGFKAKQQMEVVNVNGSYQDNRMGNLATACIFCTQCFFLEAVGKGEFGGGTLVYLPEMAQNQLNALCHILFSNILMGGSSAMQARNVYRDLRLRAQLVDKQIGEGLSNPSLYGRLLIELADDKTSALHKQMVTRLRLLPDIMRFARQIRERLLVSLTSFEELGKIKR